MIEGLLPIGSVVLIGEGTKKVMIVGVCQVDRENEKNRWDYSGVLYPEGFFDSETMLMFNTDQIKQIYCLGYQDIEQLKFKEKLDAAYRNFKTEL